MQSPRGTLNWQKQLRIPPLYVNNMKNKIPLLRLNNIKVQVMHPQSAKRWLTSSYYPARDIKAEHSINDGKITVVYKDKSSKSLTWSYPKEWSNNNSK